MFAIRNVVAVTVTAGHVEDATILVDGATIRAVGRDVDVPPGTEIVDGEGAWAVPGFIDAHCHPGVTREATAVAWQDTNEHSGAATPHLRALDSFCPEDVALERAILQGGVTAGNVSPGSSNVFGGSTALMSLGGSLVADDLVLRDPSAVKMAFGENPTNNGRSGNRLPTTRMGLAAVVRETLTAVRYYVEKRRKAAEKDELFEPDLRKEALVGLLEGKLPAHCHAHTAEDIVTAVRLAKEFDYRVVILHGTDAYRIADFLAAADVPVILGPVSSFPGKHENRRRAFEAFEPLVRAGVRFAISTDHPVLVLRDLRTEAAHMVNRGLDRQTALEAITIEPARILGVESMLGSLQPGKRADIVLWSGDPLDIAGSTVRQAYIGGRRMRASQSALPDAPQPQGGAS